MPPDEEEETRVTATLPADLARFVREEAKRERRSISSEVVWLLELAREEVERRRNQRRAS